MAPQPKTKLSTRRLSEVARHVIIPSGIVTTGWPAVEAKCREFGDEFDEWQAGAGRLILGKRADGIYAATIGGVTLSIPRQVAKTFLVGRIVFVLCVLFPGLRVIWTAHRTRTATNTFKHLQGYAKKPKVAPHVADIRRANGEQEILFTNGSVIMFGAREAGFGRGFDEVDVEVFDEAQILTEKALEDMVAATNQSRHRHGALLFFMGTPPRPVDPGEAFTQRRADALSHKPDPEEGFGEPVVGDEQVYIECSADRGADPDDRKQWAKANPSYPHRTPVRSMLRLRTNLPSDESWRREALGIWDAPGAAWTVITQAVWLACADPSSSPVGEPAFAFDVTPDKAWCSIAAAGLRADGMPHAEVFEHRPGTSWAAARLVELKQKWGSHVRIVADLSGPAGSVATEAKALGLEVEAVGTREYAGACGMLLDMATERRFRHRTEPVLDAALAGAVKLPVGDGAWKWSRKNSQVVISPLVAVTLALGAVGTPVAVGFKSLDDYLDD